MHLAVEQGQKPLSVVITAGQRGDSPQFEPVLEAIRVPRIGLGRPRRRPDRVRADKAHDSQSNRSYLRRRGIKATIPIPADRVRNRLKRGSRGGRRRSRQGRLQAAARGRVRDQSPQAPPRRR
ncbi:transposase [Streptomyces sp. NPDC056069]|uniref:transposase n=1 Tax=Streptomyces sp. NPDC056069 TaxID=3345702 RepID=UPI0035DDD5B5